MLRHRKLRFLGLLLLGLLLYPLPFAARVYLGSPQQAAPGLAPSGHGLWLAHRWWDDRDRKPLSLSEMEAMARRCRRCGITDLFVHVGPVDSQGRLPSLEDARFQRVRQVFAREAPQARWLAWIGAPNADYLGPAADTFDLGDKAGRATLLKQIEVLSGVGFAGVHYDFEPLEDGDPEFLHLLEETRQQRGKDFWLSVATPEHLPPGIPRWIPLARRLWTSAYFREVGLRSDQLVLMGYDTFQPTCELYSRYLNDQIRRIARVCPCDFVVGVPTYEDNPPYHNPRAETLQAGIEGVLRSPVRKVAIYCEWTSDEAEWKTMEASVSR